ncbi:MAG: JAB domain-containing protein [Janthinobacterium lividum]
MNYLKFKMGSLKVEHFRVLFLNQKNIILADELLGVGMVNQAPVYASREVVKRILFHDALPQLF